MSEDSPYRSVVSQTRLDAESAFGRVSLLVAPKDTRLVIGAEVWSFADDHLSIISPGRRRTKKKSLLLRGAHLYVARAWPTNECSLWIERKPGLVERLVGLPPVPGISQETYAQWQKLEQLAKELQLALQEHAAGARSLELGQGQHRVLALAYSDRIVLFARPLFRERPRRLVELHRDNKIVLARRKNDRIISMEKGVEVIATGDRIQFCHPDGEIAASVYLPWIGAEARAELTRRFHNLVAPQESDRVRSARDSEFSLNRQLRIISNP